MIIPEHKQQFTLFCAFRYALGRKTVGALAVASLIEEAWSQLPTSEKNQYQKEILEYKELHGSIGMAIDECEWMKIAQLPNTPAMAKADIHSLHADR